MRPGVVQRDIAMALANRAMEDDLEAIIVENISRSRCVETVQKDDIPFLRYYLCIFWVYSSERVQWYASKLSPLVSSPLRIYMPSVPGAMPFLHCY